MNKNYLLMMLFATSLTTFGQTTLTVGPDWSSGSWSSGTPIAGQATIIDVATSNVDADYTQSRLINTAGASDVTINGVNKLTIDNDGTLENISSTPSIMTINCNLRIGGTTQIGSLGADANNYVFGGNLQGGGTLEFMTNVNATIGATADFSGYNGNYRVYKGTNLIFDTTNPINGVTGKQIRQQENGTGTVTINSPNICNSVQFWCNSGNNRFLNVVFNANQDNIGKFILLANSNTTTNAINVTIGPGVTSLQFEDHSGGGTPVVWAANQTLNIINFADNVLNFGGVATGLTEEQLAKITVDVDTTGKELTLTSSGDLVLAPTLSAKVPFSNVNFSIYPNPVDNILNIESEEQIAVIQITDVLGKTITTQKGKLKSVNTANFAKGIYILKVFAKNGASTAKKFIKK